MFEKYTRKERKYWWPYLERLSFDDGNVIPNELYASRVCGIDNSSHSIHSLAFPFFF